MHVIEEIKQGTRSIYKEINYSGVAELMKEKCGNLEGTFVNHPFFSMKIHCEFLHENVYGKK